MSDEAKRTVIFLVSAAKRTGVGREALCQARLLAEAGCQIIFCCQRGGSLQAEAEKSGLGQGGELALPTRSGFWRFFFDVARLRKIARLCLPAAIFVYRTNDHLTAAMACGSWLPVVRFWPGRRLASAPASRMPFLLSRRWCAATLCPSPDEAWRIARLRGANLPEMPADFAAWDACEQLAAGAGVYFTPSGVDTAFFSPGRGSKVVRQEQGWSDDSKIFGMVSPLKPERGYRCFLRALAIAQAQEPAIRGLIIASTTRKERAWLANEAAPLRLGVEVAVVDAGDRYGEVLSEVDAGVILHPGSAGTGRAAIEMMSMAKPVIVFPHGLLAFLATSKAALDIPREMALARDEMAAASALTDLMLRICRDADLRLTLGQTGRRMVEERLSLPCLQKRLLAIVSKGTGGAEKGVSS